MSSRRAHELSRTLLVVVSLLLTTTAVGCWEQWSNDWFPQMKWQKAVQAFEATNHASAPNGFLPAAGSVPVGGMDADIGRMDVAAADALVNPRDGGDYRSLENGRVQYDIFCATCHGSSGLGDGPVSMTGPITGPFAGVFPLVGLVSGRSDGYLYNVIRIGSGGFPGFRMPAYRRIPAQDRWDIVNYVRFLDSKGGTL